jgi:hypothetical protein
MEIMFRSERKDQGSIPCEFMIKKNIYNIYIDGIPTAKFIANNEIEAKRIFSKRASVKVSRISIQLFKTKIEERNKNV